MIPAQGTIITVEGMKSQKFLVVSKDFFNATEQVIVCPVTKDTFEDPLHIPIQTKKTQGIVMCEQLKLLDLHIRGFSQSDQIAYADVINVTDAIQSIFDY